MTMMHHRHNRKAQVFVIGIIIIVTAGLISSYILLQYMLGDKTKDEHLGTYESAMMDTIIDGDEAFLYIDQSAKYSSEDALRDFTKNGGLYIPPDTMASDVGETTSEDILPCGKFVYPLWNSESAECYPDYRETFSQYFDDVMKKRLSSSTNAAVKKDVHYEYTYAAQGDMLLATTSDVYTFMVYKSRTYAESEEVQQYAQLKENVLTASDRGELKVMCASGECFTDVAEYYYKQFGPEGEKCSYLQYRPIDPYKKVYIPKISKSTCAFDCSGWIWWIGSHAGVPSLSKQLTAYEYMKTADDLVASGGAEYICGDDPRLTTPAPGQHIYFKNVAQKIPCTKDVVLSKAKPGDIIFSNVMNKPERGRYHAGHIMFYAGNGILIHDGGTRDGLIKKPLWSSLYATGNNPGSMIAIYRFKYVPGGVTSINFSNPEVKKENAQIYCQTADNTDWKITNMMVSSKSLTADQKLRIILTIENPSKDCVSVAPWPIITRTDNSVTYTYIQSKRENIYKQSETAQYRNIELECEFAADETKRKELEGQGKCALIAPTGDTKIRYKITASAVDIKARPVTDKNRFIEIEVAKAKQSTQGNNTNTTNATVTLRTDVELTKAERQKFEATKSNIERKNLMPIIQKYADKYGIPKEILLGKITVESGAADSIQKSCNSANACGISQVVLPLHNSNVRAACGKDYTRQEYLDDVECQINTGAYVLKQMYVQHAKKGVSVPICLRGQSGNTYYEWEAALRAYNGLGKAAMQCRDSLGQQNYVPMVMKYASAWGYVGTETITEYSSTSKEEINKGIIGKYTIRPSFSANINFDMRLVEELNVAMMDASERCKGKDEKCINSSVNDFNKNTSSAYIANGTYVALTMDCEESANERIANQFVQNIEECWASSDTECQCELRKSSSVLKVKGNADKTAFSIESNGNTYEAESYHVIYDENGELISEKDINTGSNPVYKGKDYLKFKNVTSKKCEPVKNRFKLCLKTNYTVPIVKTDRLEYENLTLRFAITLKDNLPPNPVENVSLSNKMHAINSVIVSWSANPEKDIRKYFIYLADSENAFGTDITQIKSLHHRELDVRERGYATYQDISLVDPRCEIVDDQLGKYCSFRYNATLMNNSKEEISLEDNKLYYLNSTGKFMYILNGSDAYNGLVHGRTKYIAVTAMDLSGNEIDNTNESQKITLGKNMQQIDVKNTLEPGFVDANIMMQGPGGIMPYGGGSVAASDLVVTWVKPTIYIDGTTLAEDDIEYGLYKDWTSCSAQYPEYCSIMPPYAAVRSEHNMYMTTVPAISLGMLPARIGLVAKAGDRQYNYAFTKMVG